MVNVSNFKEFVEKINRDINEKYDNFSVQLYNARKKLRNNKSGKSKYKLFSLDEKFLDDNYDYNIGGQTEVQYHIRKSKSNYIYYGLGFSFEPSMSNPNPFDTVKPFTDVFLDKNFKIYLNKFIDKGYNFIHCSLDDFENPKKNKYYLFGKSLVINNDEISDEDYDNILNDFTTDLFELYKKIFEERNKFLENNDIQIDDENDLLSKCQELLESNYNLILTGAPGTGKTYLAKQIAAKMIFGEDKNIDEMNDDEKAKFEYQYKFVQFHPSYDYTDFVEGIRPVTKENNYGFERIDGTFKKFCRKASKHDKTVINEKDVKAFCSYIEENISENQSFPIINIAEKENNSPITQIIYDDEGVRVVAGTKGSQENGFSTKTYKEILKIYENYINDYIILDHKNMENFISKVGIKEGEHTYIHGFLQAMYEYFNKKFIFVIDEINRGDINKILGELFYAIDLGYRGEKGKVDTQYQNLIESGDVFEHGFYIPENVYIIGTMNDIDRSVESMDFAIRRRFAWQEVKPEDTAEEILKNVKIDNVVSVLNDFNETIADKDALGEMYQIGASYFLKLNNYIDDKVTDQESIKNAYQKLWDNHLKGLICEYVRGKRNSNEIFNKIEKKYFDLTGINCKENNEDTAE